MAFTLRTDIYTSSPIFEDDNDWNTVIGSRFGTELIDEDGDVIDSEAIDIFSGEEATTETKWDAAEDRLLARHGLTRADVILDRD